MRVAVWGAAGVVGSAVVQAMRFDPDKRVDSVVCIDRRRPAAVQPHVEFREVDEEADDLAPHFQGVDALVNVSQRSGGRPGAAVDATARLLDAAAAAGVRHVVQRSSFAAYSPAPPLHDPVRETWPLGGVAPVPVAEAAAALERWLERFAADHPVVRVVRLRAGVALGPRAVAQFRQRLGPLATSLRSPGRLPVVPGPGAGALPAVHHDDLAAAYRLAVTGTGAGPYNVALETPLDLAATAAGLGGRPLAVPAGLLARGAALAGHFAGRIGGPLAGAAGLGDWVALAQGAPRLDTTRARDELGWTPVHSLDDALRATLAGH